uniref:Retrovirus-related Pol polyprotein from transposon TNT 1-94 n=1 Tax=Tanacetum cinerariifolium TaxID=118510 RepID=A0A6L2NM19_TANCI|nr:retrovirus-related Pol polyprotein from transposon TNT 1-94 [Tanacetum cinerariifolium]
MPASLVYDSSTKPDKDLSQYNKASAPIIEDWVFDSEDDFEAEPTQNAPSFVQPHEHVKTPRPSVKPVDHSIPADNLRKDSPKFRGHSNSRNSKACFVCKSLTHLIKDCDYYEKKMVQTPARNHAQRGNHQHYARMTHPNPQRHVLPTTVLTRSKLVPLTVARPFTTAVPHSHVTRTRPTKNVVTKLHSPPKRTINLRSSPKHSNFHHNVTTVKTDQVDAVKGVKRNPQQALKDKRVIESRCSRHMAGNMSYLSEFEAINEGYVAFGGNPKGDIKCIVLSFDFKLPDKNHVLLRVHRENNMYNVELKSIVPSGDLTCFLPRSDNGTEFKNQDLNQFCGMKGMKKEFSVARTPQQNGIAERKNMTLIEAARTMLADSLLPVPFWAETVNTACYVQNMVLVTKPHNKTPYELLLGRPPSIGFMRPFGCLVTILNTLDPLGKFDGKADEEFLVAYSVSSKAFRVFNSRTRIIQETLHINFLENKPNVAGSGPTWLFDIDTLTKSMNYQPVTTGNQPNPSAGIQEHFNAEKAGKEIIQQYMFFPFWSFGSKDPQNTNDDTTFEVKEPEFEVEKSKSEVHVFPSISAKTKKHDGKTTKEAKEKSHVELSTGFRNLSEEFEDFSDSIINEEELLQFKMQKVWVLVDLPKGKRAIGSKWVFRNKKDERVARIEATRLFLAYSSFMGFMVYQMDVKSAFLYGTIEEEVYVCQPPGFEDPDYPDKVYKVVKALYGLYQASRAWYETLANYLLENGFQMGKINQTLFIKKQKGDILLVQLFVDDIIFGSTNKDLCKAFEKLMKDNQDKYVAKILRKFGLTDEKSASTPIDIEKTLLKDPDSEDVDVHTYRLIFNAVSLKFLLFGLTNWCCSLNAIRSQNASEGFDQILDFLNASAIQYALTVIISEDTVCQALQLDDVESIDCLTNEEIFTELARMGYEKPSTKITFYKAFFSAQFTSTPPPSPHQSSQQPPSSPPQQPQPSQPSHDAAISMDLLHTLLQTCNSLTRKVEALEQDKVAQAIEIIKLKQRVRKLEKKNKVKTFRLRRLKKDDKPKPGELKEVIKVVTTAKLMTEVVTVAATTAASTITDTPSAARRSKGRKVKSSWKKRKAKALKRKTKSSKEKAAKKQKLDEKVKELKKHLQIVPNDEDTVYTKATPLALKVHVLDYQIHTENNKPYYKIIRADGSHQLFLSFLSLLRNFDKEDLEMLWQIVQERFTSSKSKNFSDDFFLNTLKAMFEKLDVEALIWKNQRGIYGLAKVKS